MLYTEMTPNLQWPKSTNQQYTCNILGTSLSKGFLIDIRGQQGGRGFKHGDNENVSHRRGKSKTGKIMESPRI